MFMAGTGKSTRSERVPHTPGAPGTFQKKTGRACPRRRTGPPDNSVEWGGQAQNTSRVSVLPHDCQAPGAVERLSPNPHEVGPARELEAIRRKRQAVPFLRYQCAVVQRGHIRPRFCTDGIVLIVETTIRIWNQVRSSLCRQFLAYVEKFPVLIVVNTSKYLLQAETLVTIATTVKSIGRKGGMDDGKAIREEPVVIGSSWDIAQGDRLTD